MLTTSAQHEDAMDKVSETIGVLSDGAWHLIKELPKEAKVDDETLLRIVNFFRDYGFIELSIGGEAAKLDPDYIKL